MVTDNELARLREAIEQKVGRKIRTPKDFDYLYSCIYDKCGTMVSISSLKRIWGYVATDSSPRLSTLDPLAQFVGYSDWDAFVEQGGGEPPYCEESTPAEPDTASQPKHRAKRHWVVGLLLAAVAIAATGYFLTTIGGTTTATQQSGQRVLRKGQDCFRTIDEYLTLFGIASGDTAYFRPVPGLTEVYVWGPEYGHPVWHNEGDTLQLMPTITEYWAPLPGTADYQSEEYIKEVNAKLYFERMTKDELRITFMRDLVSDFYVFLGVYRMDSELSTAEKFVWRRVADDCDLGRLGDLEHLRDNSR